MREPMDESSSKLMRMVNEKLFGKYRAFVASNDDPENRGRLQLHIPSVLGEAITDWALPCLPFGGAGYGWFAVPTQDAQVWVEFEEGDINRPIWTGAFWQQTSDVPTDAAKKPPTTHMLQTPVGHILQFDDKEGKERFRLHHPSSAEITIDENGTIVLTDAAGATVTLDADSKKIVVEDVNRNILVMDSAGTLVEDGNGNKIELVASGITLKGQQIVIQGTQVMLGGQGGEQLVKGMSFMSIFNSHVHACSPSGPSGPPIPPMTPANLSTKVSTT